MTKKQREERLAELYDRIEREIEFVDIKPYSHNIISLNLRTISKEFGYNIANETIDEFGLTLLGWKHEKEPKTNNSKVRSSKWTIAIVKTGPLQTVRNFVVCMVVEDSQLSKSPIG